MSRHFLGLLQKWGIHIALGPKSREVKAVLNSLRPRATNFELIRVGDRPDGGYLIPDDLQGIRALYSPGVGNSVDFELFFASRGVPCFLADGTITGPPEAHSLFKFEPKNLGLTDTSDTISLDTWISQESWPAGDLVLQMDIEGDEWEILGAQGTRWAERFRIVVIEFHHLASRVQRKSGMSLVKSALSHLLETHLVVHAHPNNYAPQGSYRGVRCPEALEVTFLRKDRVSRVDEYSRLPHSLDRPNRPEGPETPFPKGWT